MKTFCYHARNLNGQKIFGGMTHAESMEETAKRVIKQNKLQVVRTYQDTLSESHHLEKDGKQIWLYVSVHPENLGLIVPRESQEKQNDFPQHADCIG